MEKDYLKKVILSQNDSLNLDNYIERDIGKDFDLLMNNDEIIIFSGIRRAGKSTILNYIKNKYKGNCYLNFDDIRLNSFVIDDFIILYEVLIELFGNQKIFYFDEIQLVVGWEKFVRTLHNEGKKVIITGSNASMLSRELGTHLTGRNIQVEIFPFSFKEFLKFKQFTFSGQDYYSYEKLSTIKRLFQQYIDEGGFPQYLKNKNKDFYKGLYENIFYKDVVVRYGIRNEKTLSDLLYYLFSNISKEVSFTKLKNILGISSAVSVKEYINYFENSYLLFVINKFDYSLKKQLINPKKIYSIDTGFSSAVSFEFSKNNGQKLENIVFIELKRRSHEIFYHRVKKECDFLLRDRGTIIGAIQVCWSMYEQETKEREIQGLLEAMNTYGLQEGTILTNDDDEIIDIQGKTINIIPVWKWLLS